MWFTPDTPANLGLMILQIFVGFGAMMWMLSWAYRIFTGYTPKG